MVGLLRCAAGLAPAVLALVPVQALFLTAGEARRPAARPWPEEFDGCASIQVARLAATDGSVITCLTCDGNYRQWVEIVLHETWPENSVNKICSGEMHTETPIDPRGVVQSGEIPQVAETVYQHHERLDGGGYPRGQMDKNSFPEAKILGVADAKSCRTPSRWPR